MNRAKSFLASIIALIISIVVVVAVLLLAFSVLGLSFAEGERNNTGRIVGIAIIVLGFVLFRGVGQFIKSKLVTEEEIRPQVKESATAKSLISVLQAANGEWLTRDQVAGALGKGELTAAEIEELQRLSDKGRIEYQHRPKPGSLDVERMYRITGAPSIIGEGVESGQ